MARDDTFDVKMEDLNRRLGIGKALCDRSEWFRWACWGPLKASECEYLVRCLTDCATHLSAVAVWDLEDFDTPEENLAQAITVAYTATCDPNRLLRDEIVKVMLNKGELLKGGNEHFDKISEAAPTFAADMIKAPAKDRHDQRAASAAEPKV
ncbi:hypothetical protein DOTSEDRAFT_37350 [Dothistroma septosporum NZE10]|uniref:Uncharacterized protein n=1 Tax=Dothistroma septosporum (strain NZE10 / CBS 128990) TaxID=675120 RepID=N1PDT9_DOTSN|nr:hypothetical protein DOTSEDRAFT_37350 [Dothistroma septosporum NZE10]